MIVGFKFSVPTDGGKFVNVPPSMLLAYSMAKKKKRDSIIYSLLSYLVCILLLTENTFGFLGIMQGRNWSVFLSVCSGIPIAILCYFISWSGPKAVLLFSAIETEQFKENLEEQIAKVEEMIKPENIILNHLDNKIIKHLQKIITSMETLVEISEEVDQIEDISSGIRFLNRFTNLYGFDIRDLTKVVINTTKQI